MLNQHAISYRDRITIPDLDYIIRKANRLGKSGREIVRIYQEEDEEGIHLYFEVRGHEERTNE